MDSNKPASDATIKPAMATEDTNSGQGSVAETDTLLDSGWKLYHEYLLWQAHKAIEELHSAEWKFE